MDKYRKLVAWSEEDQSWIATSPDFSGLSAFGDSEVEATTQLLEVIAEAVQAYEKEGWALPQPQQVQSDFSGQLRLRLPRAMHALAAQKADEEGVSLNSLLQSYIAAGLGTAVERSRALQELQTYYSTIADSLGLTATHHASADASHEWPNPISLYGIVSGHHYGVPPVVVENVVIENVGTPGAFSGRMQVLAHIRPQRELLVVPGEVYK